MTSLQATGWPRRGPAATALAAFLIAASIPAAVLRAQTCAFPGDVEPAVPVPECVDEDGYDLTGGGSQDCPSVCAPPGCNRLWSLEGLHPAPPGERLPLDRDSTQYIGQTKPAFQSGHELFHALDFITVDGVSSRLYMAYTAGFQVWDILPREDGGPDNPARLKVADGPEGHFLSYPGTTEKLSFIDDISTLYDPATGKDVIAVSALQPVGPSFWEYDPDRGGGLTQLYQDTGTRTRQMRLVNLSGTFYAFAATDDGVLVYNVTTARSLSSPCEDHRGTSCSGVYRGFLPTTNSRIFIDALVARTKPDRVFVATGNGGTRPVEIWEVLDPQIPSLEGPGAQLRFAGGDDLRGARGFQLFAYKNRHYLALVHAKAIKIFLIDDCLDLSGLATCAPVPVTVPLAVRDDVFSAEEYLRFSTTGGKAYLYYGMGKAGLSGSDVDQLFDISRVSEFDPEAGPLSAFAIPRLPEEGGSYVEPCNNQNVSYWSHYYPRNFHGLREFQPRQGRFASNGYFYRAATGIFDIHVIGDPPTDDRGKTRVTIADISPPRNPQDNWMGDQFTFQAEGFNGCDPTGMWIFSAKETNPDVEVVQIDQQDDLAFYQFNCVAASGARCSNTAITVTARNTAPSCVDAQPLTLTVKDPKIDAGAIDPSGGAFESCEGVNFSAELSGRGPAWWEWRFSGQAQPECNGAIEDERDLAGTSTECALPPEPIDRTTIFTDGFESGDASRWVLICRGDASDPPECTEELFDLNTYPPRGLNLGVTPLKGLPSLVAELIVWDTADKTSASERDSEQVEIDIIESGVPAFIGSPEPVVSGPSATFDFPADNTTTWTWEFEDPTGTAACSFAPGKTCVTLETKTATTTHGWQTPGTYGYQVTISNCGPDIRSRSGSVTVEEGGVTPVIKDFSLVPGQANCCFDIFVGVQCNSGVPIEFRVTMAEVRSYSFEFDWLGDLENPDFDPANPSSSSGKQWNFLHTFSPSNPTPIVRVSDGGLSAEKSFSSPLPIGNGVCR